MKGGGGRCERKTLRIIASTRCGVGVAVASGAGATGVAGAATASARANIRAKGIAKYKLRDGRPKSPQHSSFPHPGLKKTRNAGQSLEARGMDKIEELLRLPSPAPRPQALAFDGTHLWMGSLETHRLYAIDPRTWTVGDEAQAPGKPYGMTVVGDELRVLCSEGPDDNRIIRRFIPGHGFRTQ